MNKRIDLTGQKFNNLTAIKFAKIENDSYYWEFKCDCGNIKISRSSDVKNGNVKSCGCLRESNLVGKRFGKLIAIERFPRYKNKITYYKCLCDCGNEKIISSRYLDNGCTKSCGCLIVNRTNLTNIKKYKTSIEHKLSLIMKNMKTRCYNPNRDNNKYYYDKSITICDEWLDKKNGTRNFIDWAIANGYKEEKLSNGRNKWTIDRIDNSKGYTPENCKWATDIEQARNKTSNKKVIYNNQSYVLTELLHLSKVGFRQLYKRVEMGWDIEKALLTPAYKYKRLVAKE